MMRFGKRSLNLAANAAVTAATKVSGRVPAESMFRPASAARILGGPASKLKSDPVAVEHSGFSRTLLAGSLGDHVPPSARM